MQRMRLPTAKRVLIGAAGLAGLALVGFAILAWQTAIAPIDVPSPAAFPAEAVRRGAQLAALGDCGTCHTAPDGRAFAGGRPIPTPFGAIFSTNITPDARSGIGRWSEAAFRRAMRAGVDREGHHLYPAFPYDHFTLVSDADDAALYAFLMTRAPVQTQPLVNHLPVPLDVRWLIAGWKLLFFKPGPYVPDPAHDALWNRGSYLANGIGHCGACHTPRNRLGAENHTRPLAGGDAGGWHAYAINSASKARERWDVPALQGYLRYGWHAQHGVALGPMGAVTDNLATVPAADLQAIASYVAGVMSAVPAADGAAAAAPDRAAGPPANAAVSAGTATGAEHAAAGTAGRLIYESSCAGCHDGVRPPPFGGLRLPLSTAVTGDSATNFINVVLNGLPAREGRVGAIMPGFAAALTDGQLESLVAYVRATFGGGPPWTGLDATVRESRNRDHD